MINNFKYFKYTFNISRHKYYGSWKSNLIYKDFETFKDFKNFEYNGLKILQSGKYSVLFKIDKQLLRKLKILNLSDCVEKTEKLILYFTEHSVEKTEDEIFNNRYSYYNFNHGNYSISYAGSSYYIEKPIDEYEIQQRKDRKKNLKYQSKNVSLKAKQYTNNVKIRK